MSISVKLKKYIRNSGLKQCFVAEKSGFTENQLSQMLNDKRVITADDLEIICNALDCTPNDIYQIKTD